MQENPSSRTPSQSSSSALHVSAGGVHELPVGRLQIVVQIPLPAVPQLVVHVTSLPRTHGKPSSGTVSQSSSSALHVSVGGVQADGAGVAHEASQLPVPVVPHVVVQDIVVPRMQGKPSSRVPSQSSSTPLHVSSGGVQTAPVGSAQLEVQVPVPVVPQLVVHDTVSPGRQTYVSSVEPSQSSSNPLQLSAGGTHVDASGTVQVDEQGPLPEVPHDVVHAVSAPRTHGSPSSPTPSQSSSNPLQLSAGGVHSAGRGSVQSEWQAPRPLDPHVVVQATSVPDAQTYVSSASVSQSSSRPLHRSPVGWQNAGSGSAQSAVHVPEPVEPHGVSHAVARPWAHA